MMTFVPTGTLPNVTDVMDGVTRSLTAGAVGCTTVTVAPSTRPAGAAVGGGTGVFKGGTAVLVAGTSVLTAGAVVALGFASSSPPHAAVPNTPMSTAWTSSALICSPPSLRASL